MNRFDQRLEKLEQQTHPEGHNIRIVFVNRGETKDEAIARTGADPSNTMFVSWKSPDQTAPH